MGIGNSHFFLQQTLKLQLFFRCGVGRQAFIYKLQNALLFHDHKLSPGTSKRMPVFGGLDFQWVSKKTGKRSVHF